jgi:integrase
VSPKVKALVLDKQKDVFFSRSGYEVNFDDDLWVLDKNKTLSFISLKEVLGGKEFLGLKNTLKVYACLYSSYHAVNMSSHLIRYFKYCKSNQINSLNLISFRSSLSSSDEYILGSLKGFLKKWYALGYEGVSKEVVDLLNSWTLKGNIKGDVVKRLDPEEGPLSDIEQLAFNEGAVQSYEKGLITIDELAMSLMASGTGRREIQISHMRLKDVLKGQNHKNEPAYILNIPKAKQRGATFRSSFNQLQITEELWTILDMQSKSVVERFTKHFGTTIPSYLLIELPLFPDYQKLKEVHDINELEKSLSIDVLHIESKQVTVAARTIVKIANIYSERTGELLNMTARRFRYTTGTRAAREGFGVLVIAELLDHSDTQNAHVYIENIPEYAARINAKMGHLLAPYAKSFQGQLVDSESDAVRGLDKNSRIRLNPHENIGTCGSYDFCGSRVPVPCYTCNHFQPWLDAPHQKILDELIAERDRIAEVTGDLAIASVNDRTIIAVAEVIQRCEARRQELNHA